MRLSCPNCGAQYEVPDEVIPVAGRDVQCSNCGDTWFQKHKDAPDDEAALAASDGDFDQDTGGSAPDAVSEGQSWEVSGDETSDEIADGKGSVPSEQSDEADQMFAPSNEATNENESPDDWGGGGAPDMSQDKPVRQILDPEISNVLREEAALETAARASEGSNGLESQPELGLAEPKEEGEGGVARRAQEARTRMARMRGESDPQFRDHDGIGENLASGGTVSGSRRDLLPDIEEINSTLRSTKDRRAASDALDPASPESLPQQRRRRGFRRGFLMALVLAIVLTLVYVYAPLISAKLPAIASMLSSYVEKINMMRLWLDTQVSAILVWLDMKAIGDV